MAKDLTWQKDWTWQEIRDLAALAQRKGINKGLLAKEYIGVTRQHLSVWMREGRTSELPMLTRNALSYVEMRLERMKDI